MISRWLSTEMTMTVLALAALTLACRAASQQTRQETVPTMVRSGTRVTVPDDSPLRARLQIEEVRRIDVPREVTAPAVVEADPARLARVVPPLPGRIVALLVQVGDRVRAGDPLFRLDAPDLGAARTDAARAAGQLAQAERTLARQQDLAARGIVGQKEVEQARTDRDAAQDEAARTRDRLRLLGADPRAGHADAALVVRAPLAGKVLDVAAAPGELRNDATTPVLTIADLSTIWITANVPERDIHLAQAGAAVSATLAAYPGETFAGRVRSVADLLDPETRTLKVRVALPNPDGRLKPAMFATVTLRAWSTPALTVPTSALVMRGAQTTVFVQVAAGTFEQRTVETGEQQAGRALITRGLDAGDRILTRDGTLLQ